MRNPGDGFVEHQTQIWMGDKNGSFKAVIPLPPISIINVMSEKKGERPSYFRGAIVRLANVKVDDKYCTV